MDKQSGESEEEEVNCEMTVLGVFTYLFFYLVSLQCFGSVGLATRRASGA